MQIIHAHDGAEICFNDRGEGSPVLFLHGWLMSQRVWHFQLPLAASLRIITLDLRGHGHSRASAFSYAACLRDIETVLDHLDIGTVVLAGWSMGSQLAIMAAAATLAKRLSGILLIGGTSCFCSKAGVSSGLPANDVRGMAIRLKRAYQETSRQFFSSMFSAEETASLDVTALAAQTVCPLPSLQTSLAALQELSENDIRQLLPCIPLPALLIHGDKDSICPLEGAEYIAGQLPRATMTRFPGAGHAPFLSYPGRFNAEVNSFVRRVNGRD